MVKFNNIIFFSFKKNFLLYEFSFLIFLFFIQFFCRLTNNRRKQQQRNTNTYGRIYANKLNHIKSNNDNNSYALNNGATTTTNSKQHQANNKIINSTRLNNNNSNNNTNRSTKMIKQPFMRNNNYNRNSNMNGGRLQQYSPLQTPPRLKSLNNGGGNYGDENGGYSRYSSSKKSNIDPYNINPLPNIRSPYRSSREQHYALPNLESWGIKNASGGFDDALGGYYRYNPSPLMPMYSLLNNKSQKVRRRSHFFSRCFLK